MAFDRSQATPDARHAGLALASRWVGLGGLCLIALAAGTSTAGIYIGLGLMGLALVPHAPSLWAAVKGTWMVWAMLALAGYIVLRTVMMPEAGERQWDWARNVLYIGGLPALVVAFWLALDLARIGVVLVLLIAGVLGGLIVGLDWSLLPEALAGQDRLGDPYAINRVAFLLAGCLIALVTLGPRAVARLNAKGKAWQVPAAIVLSLAALVLLQGIILTQARQVWLALLIVLPTLGGLIVMRYRTDWRVLASWRGRLILALGALTVVSLLLFSTWTPLSERLQAEQHTWDALAEGRMTDIEGSLGRRLEMWAVSAQMIGDRPVWGWGPGQTRAMMTERGSERIADNNSHNLILELGVGLGVVGWFLTGPVVWTLVRTSRAGLRRHAMPYALRLMLLGQALLLIVVNQVDIRFDDPHVMACIVIITAIGLAPWLHGRLQQVGAKTQPLSAQN
jgi:O-antigen ligase